MISSLDTDEMLVVPFLTLIAIIMAKNKQRAAISGPSVVLLLQTTDGKLLRRAHSYSTSVF